jgi:hypothetical protein
VRCLVDGNQTNSFYLRLEELNEYPNIARIHLSRAMDGDLDLSGLCNIESIVCKNLDIDLGGLILGPKIERVYVKGSRIRGGIDCSRCLNLNNITIESCDGHNLREVQGERFAGVTYPNEVPVKVHITGMWQTGRALNSALQTCAAKNVVITNDATVKTTRSARAGSPNSVSVSPKYAAACVTLGITEAEGRDKVKVNRAYRARIAECHPDKNPGNVAEATERSAKVVAARDVIFQENNW